MRIKDYRIKIKNTLEAAGIKEWDVEGDILLMEVLGLDRAGLFLCGDDEFPMEKNPILDDFLRKRCSRIPLSQILGAREFMGLNFKVNEHVLTPRQETEILVEACGKYIRPGDSVLDLCTGSGCIIISLYKIYGEGKIKATAVDISEEALRVARENAKNLGAEIVFNKGDLFLALPNEAVFDIITCNPPYIRERDILDLEPEVRDHEPHLALSGGKDGLAFYRRLALESSAHLRPGGRMFMEIGYDQGEDVERIFKDAGYSGISVIKDYSGNDRVLCLCKQ